MEQTDIISSEPNPVIKTVRGLYASILRYLVYGY
jgi:hypothetical protein